jgi:putative FmdB family regulatory protein
MPIYEFVCDGCKEETSELLPIGKIIKKCPACGELKLKKVLFSRSNYHDTYSPMHPRRGRGQGGYGRIDPGQGSNIGKNLG